MKIRIYLIVEDKIPWILFEGNIEDCPEIDTSLFAHGVKLSIERT